jgi:hypothetical protein
MGGILIQSKDVVGLTSKYSQQLFDVMDPVDFGILPVNLEELPPFIRIVFSLGTTTSGLYFAPEPSKTNPPRDKAKTVDMDDITKEGMDVVINTEQGVRSELGQTKHYNNVYDMLAAGAHSDTFGVISSEQNGIYSKLLAIMGTFPAAYELNGKDPDSIKVSRHMHPCAASDSAHWEMFEPLTSSDEE